MSSIFDDSSRQVIPRWLDYRVSCSLALLRTSTNQAPAGIVSYSRNDAEREWLQQGTLDAAADFVAEALVLQKFDSPEARRAAEYILKVAPTNQLIVRDIARHFQELPSEQSTPELDNQPDSIGRKAISRLRRALRLHPIDPVAWSDLSLSFAVCGQKDKARQAMLVALSLAGENRFVLRSAARFFVHSEDPDRALRILRNSEMCGYDPWIASAEIAISDSWGRKSRCIDRAGRLVSDDQISPFARSELIACLSTVETKHGSIRQARALLQKSFRDPSENALAQAEWLVGRQIQGLHIPALADKTPGSFEAQARHFHRLQQYDRCLHAAQQWGRFQPFSSRPFILASYVASVCMSDEGKTVEILQDIVHAHKDSPMLVNNLAFGLARCGDPEQARRRLLLLHMSDLSVREHHCVTATKGLIAFRQGDPTLARRLYLASVQGFDKIKEVKAAAIASYYWALEEKRIGSPYAVAQIRAAQKRIQRERVAELQDAASKL